MKAIVQNKSGSASEVLRQETRYPDAFINKNHDFALVRVAACSLSPYDWKGVEGYFGSFSSATGKIPGCAFSGVISATGAGFREKCGFREGGEVMGVSLPCYIKHRVSFKNLMGSMLISRKRSRRNGALAEYVVVHFSEIVSKPKHLSHTQASTLPFNGTLAFLAVKSAAKLNLKSLKIQARTGQNIKILVLAADTDVGKMVTQLVKCYDSDVYAAAASEHDVLKSYGVKSVLSLTARDSLEQDLSEQHQEKLELGDRKFDIVFDCGIGDPHVFELSKRLIRAKGKFITLTPDNDRPKTLEKDISVATMSMSPRQLTGDVKYIPVYFRHKPRYMEAVRKLVESRRLLPLISKVEATMSPSSADVCFPFTVDGVRDALNKASRGVSSGKVVVVIDPKLCGKKPFVGSRKAAPRSDGDKLDDSREFMSYADTETILTNEGYGSVLSGGIGTEDGSIMMEKFKSRFWDKSNASGSDQQVGFSYQ